MTIESFTGGINTKNEYVLVETLTGVTFTVGNTYTLQTSEWTNVKVADAEFDVSLSKPYQFVMGSNDIYIKTDFVGCRLTVLENEEQGS